MHNLKTVAADYSCNNYFIYLFCVPTIFHMWIWCATYIAAGIYNLNTRANSLHKYTNAQTLRVSVSKPNMCVHRCILEMNTADTNPKSKCFEYNPIDVKTKSKEKPHFHATISVTKPQIYAMSPHEWRQNKIEYNVERNTDFFFRSFFVIVSLRNPQKFDDGRVKRTVNLHK